MIPATFDLLYEQLLLGSGNLFKYPYALLIQGLFVAVATWYYIHRRAAAAAAEPVRLTKEVIITLSSYLLSSYHPDHPDHSDNHLTLRKRTN